MRRTLACLTVWLGLLAAVSGAEPVAAITAEQAEAFFPAQAAAPNGAVEAFDYEATLTAFFQGRHPTPRLSVSLYLGSVKTVPGETGSRWIEIASRSGPGWLDVSLTALRQPFAGRPRWPATVPEKGMRSPNPVKLTLPADRPALLRLRFKNADEIYALRFTEAQGLEAAPVRAGHGRLTVGSTEGLKIEELIVREGKRLYECNSFSVAAVEGGQLIWEQTPALKGGADSYRLTGGPVKAARIVGPTLFTSFARAEPPAAGEPRELHSLYFMKDTGELVFYWRGELAGKDPLGEALECARTVWTSSATPSLAPFVRAIATLNDKGGAAFLIECIQKGFGVDEKAMAVAALERLTGNEQAWTPEYRAGRNIFQKAMYERVKDAARQAAEVAKWTGVFGPVTHPVLAGDSAVSKLGQGDPGLKEKLERAAEERRRKDGQ